MKLYGVPLSPYFSRCALVLELKGKTDAVAMPGVPGMDLKSPELLAQNPLGRIPYLELDDGRIIPEGQVICDYFERAFPQPALKPAELEGQAQSDLLCRLLDLYALPHGIFMSRELGKGADADKAVVDEHARKVAEGVAAIEHFFEPKTWAMSDEAPGMVDCAFIPFIFFNTKVYAPAGQDFLGNRPKFGAYANRVANTPLAQACFKRMAASMEMVAKMRAVQAARAAKSA